MQAASDGCGASQKAQEIVEEAAAEAGLIQGDTARLVKVLLGLRSFCLYPDDCVYTHILQVGLAMHALRGWVQQQISVCSCLLRSWEKRIVCIVFSLKMHSFCATPMLKLA